MKILEIVAELQPNREVTVNGRNTAAAGNAVNLDEKLIEKQLSLEQQWELLCLMQQTVAKLFHTYHRSRIRAGETTLENVQESARKAIVRHRRKQELPKGFFRP